MMLSLAIALAIYIPLLFIIATVGTPAGQAIDTLAARDPEGVIAVAAQQYLGPFGYWLVIVAAVLSMFSALQANIFAASRIARTMARDRTLPKALSVLSGRSRSPVNAIVVTSFLASLILVALPDVAAAGAAASLIFLVTFALAHWVAILVRQRSVRNPPPFLVPLYPVIPITGGLACIALAGFEGFVVPAAGKIVLTWLGIGGILFLALFARRARMTDVSRTARNPELLTLRGQSPLVLVPIANPQSAEALLALADSLVPAGIGRVLVQTVIVAPKDWQPQEDEAPIERSQAVVRELVQASVRAGIRADVLTTVAPEAMQEIARVSQLHRCESVLLGLSNITNHKHGTQLESLLGQLDANVVILRSRDDWRLAEASRILVPVAGRGGHEHLLALLVGSLLRTAEREVTYLRVLPTNARSEDLRRARHDLQILIDDDVSDRCHVEIVQNDDAVGTVARMADEADLLVLGVQRLDRRQKLFGTFTRQIAQQIDCPLVVMSRRG
jgi:nucleotide-binding universal stress UspA family protein